MKPHDQPHGLCSLDPISLTAIGLAVGGIGAGATAFEASKSNPSGPPVAPPAPSAIPTEQQPTGTKSNTGQGTPSFVGSAAAPSQVGYGQKSLLGQ